jgi:peptidoglycan/LPS O-acetylase OafA/YrhL
MAEWTVPAPYEPEKPHDLHDKEQQPKAPPGWRPAFRSYLVGPAIGFVFAMGFTAMAFQARASWDSHRDWVVPVTVPFLALGGVALGLLVARRQWLPSLPAFALILLGLVFVGLNIWLGAVTEGQDNLRDALSISTGVAIGLAVASALAALAWVERRRPAAPAEPTA